MLARCPATTNPWISDSPNFNVQNNRFSGSIGIRNIATPCPASWATCGYKCVGLGTASWQPGPISKPDFMIFLGLWLPVAAYGCLWLSVACFLCHVFQTLGHIFNSLSSKLQQKNTRINENWKQGHRHTTTFSCQVFCIPKQKRSAFLLKVTLFFGPRALRAPSSF